MSAFVKLPHEETRKPILGNLDCVNTPDNLWNTGGASQVCEIDSDWSKEHVIHNK